eukprot:CAMPEP_0173468674 /NCGR_PEP_ID=MMETSP1357-20121228/76972_1 /TAXON_ID=77926 /ORGANISM="Hemiselmis rufescens, Strain PCC563" /LENGTH=323 /DNA_ID=CAMNT_0014436899 /DNA_START=88 /DNA_END=1059 /DNA_ORIENTATION=+
MASLGKYTTAKQVVDHYKPDLKGKVALVTGGNSGIGVETCKALAFAGAKVILCSRKVENGTDCIEKQIKVSGGSGYAVPNCDIVVKTLDLADLKSVERCAQEVLAEFPTLDFVVCNAGVMLTPKGATAQGFETQLGTNHHGHFHLVNLLLPKIQECKSRVVLLSSSAHAWGLLDKDDDWHFRNKKYSARDAYGNSKVANMLHSLSLADKGVWSCSVMPGIVRTNLARHMTTNCCMTCVTQCFACMLRAKYPPAGASTTMVACLSPDLPGKGEYLDNCQIAKPSTALGADKDGTWRAKCWERTQKDIDEALSSAGVVTVVNTQD